MFVRLKVLKGKCGAGNKKLSAKRYLIGQSGDCHIRPLGDDVSALHCEIVVSSLGAKIQDLDSTSGTRLNGDPVETETTLESGDVVRVGEVEFMVLLVREGEEQQPVSKEERAVTDWIEEADEVAREKRRTDPSARTFAVDDIVSSAAATTEEDDDDEDERQALVKRLREEKKRPPKKLPVEETRTESSISAAEEVLKKMMAPPKKPGS